MYPSDKFIYRNHTWHSWNLDAWARRRRGITVRGGGLYREMRLLARKVFIWDIKVCSDARRSANGTHIKRFRGLLPWVSIHRRDTGEYFAIYPVDIQDSQLIGLDERARIIAHVLNLVIPVYAICDVSACANGEGHAVLAVIACFYQTHVKTGRVVLKQFEIVPSYSKVFHFIASDYTVILESIYSYRNGGWMLYPMVEPTHSWVSYRLRMLGAGGISVPNQGGTGLTSLHDYQHIFENNLQGIINNVPTLARSRAVLI